MNHHAIFHGPFLDVSGKGDVVESLSVTGNHQRKDIEDKIFSDANGAGLGRNEIRDRQFASSASTPVREQVEKTAGIFRCGLDDYIQIAGCTKLTMQADGDSANDQVAHATFS